MHGPTPSRKERQLWSYWLGRSARISSVASRHGGSGTVRLCHGCAGKFVLVAEKLTAIQWDKSHFRPHECHPRKSQKAMLTREVHQLDTRPARTNTRKRGTRAKEAKRKTVTIERIQIEATVHFGPELLSREILESQFGVLFRPNVAKITRSSLCQTR